MKIETFKAMQTDKRFSVMGIKIYKEEEVTTYDIYYFDSIKEAKNFDYPKAWDTFELVITEWRHDSESINQEEYYNEIVSTYYLEHLSGSEERL